MPVNRPAFLLPVKGVRPKTFAVFSDLPSGAYSAENPPDSERETLSISESDGRRLPAGKTHNVLYCSRYWIQHPGFGCRNQLPFRQPRNSKHIIINKRQIENEKLWKSIAQGRFRSMCASGGFFLVQESP